LHLGSECGFAVEFRAGAACTPRYAVIHLGGKPERESPRKLLFGIPHVAPLAEDILRQLFQARQYAVRSTSCLANSSGVRGPTLNMRSLLVGAHHPPGRFNRGGRFNWSRLDRDRRELILRR
jgi:hypothetical protein